jgi:hypothetical protein
MSGNGKAADVTHARGLGLALDALAKGREDDAMVALTAARQTSFIARALLRSLAKRQDANAYDAPRAFEAFIRGGGNVALYSATSAMLARVYDRYRPARLIDIGAGDGMALVPALAAASHRPREVDVVEPNATMFAKLAGCLPLHAGYQQGLEVFAQNLAAGDRWELAQSTFALQSIPPDARTLALTKLASHVDRLVIVEFDVPTFAEGSIGLYESLARRYELAATEQGEHAELVASGFLAPMLLGQLRAQSPSNWEQPAAAWVDELRASGFRAVEIEHVHDYSWAPAVRIMAVP